MGFLVGMGSRDGKVGPLVVGGLGVGGRIGRGEVIGAGVFVGVIGVGGLLLVGRGLMVGFLGVGTSVGKLMLITLVITDSRYCNRLGSSSVSDLFSTLSHRLSK